MAFTKKYAVGEIRPTQLLLNYGVGSIIDLPHISALVMGLDDWDTVNSREISEERLLRAVQSTWYGSQVKRLLAPPSVTVSTNNPFDSSALVGVPVAPFPRWMVCPRCHLLAPLDAGYFELKANPYQPDRTRYVHINCAHQPAVLPARFMIACPAGHLDDFPWVHFVHGDRPCNALLSMIEVGVSGEPSDIYIRCETCQKSRPMSDAFSSEEEKKYHPPCRGRRPHLRDFEKSCQFQARTILLSASNSWFPLVLSTFSIPQTTDTLGQLIEAHWQDLRDTEGPGDIAYLRRKHALGELETATDAEIWEAVEQKKREMMESAEVIRAADLKIPEWDVLSHPHSAPVAEDFQVTPVEVPAGYTDLIEQVVLVERLREVRALTGFTRIESLGDYAEDEQLPADHIMRISRREPYWVPAAEVRGEGIFLQFREQAVRAWLERPEVRGHGELLHGAHTAWRGARRISLPEANDPTLRYVLLHTFAHALMRQLTLACGYTAASIRERIYALPAESEGGPMAGILLYTAAPDSEGTLGGLVGLGRPDQLGDHIDGALDEIQHCASDPLCAEHTWREDGTLHQAACHACLFAPETSCERGNKYLDRSVLVPTVERADLAFFVRRE